MAELDIRDFEVQRMIDSITKYPQIPTYHEIGERGRLTENRTDSVRFLDSSPLYATEKIDGVNARIVMLPERGDETGRYFIGSREELLWAQGDIIQNPAHQIAQTLNFLADGLPQSWIGSGMIVFYLEVYGGVTTPAARRYSNHKDFTGARLFDVQAVSGDQLDALMARPIEEVASWRQHGGQDFLPRDAANRWAGRLGVLSVPVLRTVPTSEMPESVADTHAWLGDVLGDGRTTVALGTTVPGAAEGVVVRSNDRRFIAKIRVDDYRKTMDYRKAQATMQAAEARRAAAR
jgi:hypothetical protein